MILLDDPTIIVFLILLALLSFAHVAIAYAFVFSSRPFSGYLKERRL